MLRSPLGRTGLTVSRMGLGCGGHSRLGMANGASTEAACRLVQEAIDLGVDFIDTAEAYGTEDAVGRAIYGHDRSKLVISTKIGVGDPGKVRERVDGCLQRLRTEYIDVLHLHGVMPDVYANALHAMVPVLQELKAEGKVRHLAISEAFIRDTRHQMLSQAVETGPWEVVMVGFNLLNPSARRTVFPTTRRRGIGTLGMFAVRRALSHPAALRELLDSIADQMGETPEGSDPLAFLGPDLTEAAYRFCLHEPGLDVVLSGTGSAEHLRANVKALSAPPLPGEALARLKGMFENVDSVSGN